MPTFRASETKFFDVMNLVVFNNFLSERKLIFFTKLHPKSKLNDKFDSITFSNIRNLPKDIDTYAVLKYADVLITDYSSVYSDFLLLDRPSILFPYDYEEYSRDTRDCYFEYKDYMKDKVAQSMDELMQSIDEVVQKDTCQEERNKVRDWLFEAWDENASEKLYYKIINISEK
jgi:CDP-glycerol glycerophosphotransferase (TagB/SpsB family)